MLARIEEKQAKNAYQGLMPNVTAIIRPMAGYHATKPIREKEITSGRFSNKLSKTKARETTAWRRMRRREFINMNLRCLRRSVLWRRETGRMSHGLLPDVIWDHEKNGQWSGIEGNPPRLNEECQVPQSSILSRTPACLSCA